MVSSASAQIESTGGEHLRTTIRNPQTGQLEEVPDYATVQGILLGVVAAFVLVVTILGPENHASHFEKHKAAFEEGAGEDDAVVDEEAEPGSPRSVGSIDEKGVEEKREHV